MAEQHILTVLTAAGMEPADLEALKALPEDAADFAPDSYIGKIKTGVETALKNDPNFWNSLDENNVNETFKKKLQDQQYGRAAGIVRQKVLTSLGLKEEDLADVPEEDRRKLETFVSKAAEKYASSKAGDKQLQSDLVAARRQLEELQAALPEKETALQAQYETEYNNRVIDAIVLAELGSVEGLKVPPSYIADKVAAELKGGYALKVNGLRADVFQKENQNLKVLEGSKEMGLKDLVNKILVRDGLVETKTGQGDQNRGKATVDVNGEEGKLKVSSHILDKINQNK